MKALAISDWYAQHLRNDNGRQGKRVVLNYVYLPIAGRPVQQLFREGLDSGPQFFHSAGGEGLMHQSAEPRVIRFIRTQHIAIKRAEQLMQKVFF